MPTSQRGDRLLHELKGFEALWDISDRRASLAELKKLLDGQLYWVPSARYITSGWAQAAASSPSTARTSDSVVAPRIIFLLLKPQPSPPNGPLPRHTWSRPRLCCWSSGAMSSSKTTAYEPEIAILTFVYDKVNRRTFRYALIINLTFAEFIQHVSSTASGIYILVTGTSIPSGSMCNVNGWIGQVAVMASGFGVLSIALVTLLIFFFNDWAIRASMLSKTIICAFVWLQPLVAGTIALLMDKYNGVSGNWCWISFEEKTLRWALGHAWRLCIVTIMLVIYVFIFAQVRRRLKKRQNALDMDLKRNSSIASTITRPPLVRSAFSNDEDEKSSRLARLALKPGLRVLQSSKLDQETRHWAMIAAFPLTCVLVLMPQIINRVAELAGYQLKWLAVS
ncbi:hypothetical protein INS49_005548 [Diaporthe citri]|uniref:uncharacterized protein n=1 Tax=Diaporthe citri TaxID=83186 RepID=UPI001C814D15|nr:uncharacterized protein INS49_005548 [Diaporthe citri]KAG6353586.1 hypothetical protein INS49_005548 [Diaporthe citri]